MCSGQTLGGINAFCANYCTYNEPTYLLLVSDNQIWQLGKPRCPYLQGSNEKVIDGTTMYMLCTEAQQSVYI